MNSIFHISIQFNFNRISEGLTVSMQHLSVWWCTAQSAGCIFKSLTCSTVIPKTKPSPQHWWIQNPSFLDDKGCSASPLLRLTRLTEEATDIRTSTQQMKTVRRLRWCIRTLDIVCSDSGSWWNSSAITITSASASRMVVTAIVTTRIGHLQTSLVNRAFEL
jgi:hypothetical protein